MAWYTTRIKVTSIGIGSTNPPITSMCEMNGFPAFAVSEDGDLKYFSYNYGTVSWDEITVISGNVAKRSQIKLIDANGRPGIFFYDSSLKRMCFIKAYNASGSSWGHRVDVSVSTVDDSSIFGLDAFVDFINNKIVASGFNGINSFVTESTDLSGLFWFPVDEVFADLYRSKACSYGSFNFAVFSGGSSHLVKSFTGTPYHNTAAVDSGTTEVFLDTVFIDELAINPTVYYIKDSALMFKVADNTTGTVWPESSFSVLTGLSPASLSTVNVASARVDGTISFAYRKADGIYFTKGFTIKIVSGTEAFGNFGLVESDSNIYVSYYRYNSVGGFYEIWVASAYPLPSESFDSSSSSSVFEGNFIYSYFDSGNNLLNINGNMTGSEFVLPESVNACVLYNYSGDNMYNIKIEDIDNHRVLCKVSRYGYETYFDTISAGTKIRIIVNDGAPGDIINSYEVKFRFVDRGNSSSKTESFSSYSTESSASSSSPTMTTSSSSESSVSTNSSSQTISTSSSSTSSQTISTSSSSLGI